MEIILGITCLTSCVTVGSFSIGLSQYIHSMNLDMKTRLPPTGFVANVDPSNRWSIYVNEITFHNEIFEFSVPFVLL